MLQRVKGTEKREEIPSGHVRTKTYSVLICFKASKNSFLICFMLSEDSVLILLMLWKKISQGRTIENEEERKEKKEKKARQIRRLTVSRLLSIWGKAKVSASKWCNGVRLTHCWFIRASRT